MSTGIELMQHALGINERQRQPYRNYFLAGGDHRDTTEWQKLVEQGFAKSSPAPAWSCGEVVYQVTGAGEALAISALPEPKKPTRYEEYRHSEVCESFGEWLGIQLPEYECRTVDYFKGKYEYRMYRRSRIYWDSSVDVKGDWCPTKKAAKASYKAALRAVKGNAGEGHE